jgi:hypothetical protein
MASTGNLGPKYRRWNYSGVIMATSVGVRKGEPLKSRTDGRYAFKRLRKARKFDDCRANRLQAPN